MAYVRSFPLETLPGVGAGEEGRTKAVIGVCCWLGTQGSAWKGASPGAEIPATSEESQKHESRSLEHVHSGQFGHTLCLLISQRGTIKTPRSTAEWMEPALTLPGLVRQLARRPAGGHGLEWSLRRGQRQRKRCPYFCLNM